ncbi:MAG: type II secretion system protein GspM [Bryobacteraceae bacterium]
MTLSDRDRRALILLGAAAGALLLLWMILNVFSGAGRTTGDAVALQEKELSHLRILAAALPSRERQYKQAGTDLATREKMLIEATDEKLAQERLLAVVHKLAAAQAPPLELRTTELAQPKPYGNYGEVTVTVNVACRIEQLVNFLSDLSAQPEAIGSEDLHIFGINEERKEMQVRLTVGGLIPKRLLPKKKASEAL